MSRGRRGKKRPGTQGKNRRADEADEADEEEDPEPMAGDAALFGGRDEPAPELKDQYLFLFEFFVHHLTGDRLAKLNQMFFVPTCVSIEFLGFKEEDGIEVTPVDPLFQPQAGVADDIEYVYAGRSVMCAIDQDSVVDKTLELLVKMSIWKRMPEGIKPDVFVGEAELDLTMQFAALRKELLHCWHRNLPPPKVYEGEVPLIHEDNVIGGLAIYVRMSAFGQTIVTEFETPRGKTGRSYVFKGDRVDEKFLAYKCRVVDSRANDIHVDSKDGLKACPVCTTVGLFNCPCAEQNPARAQSNMEASLTEEDDGRQVSVMGTRSRSTCAEKPKGLIQSSRGTAQPCGKAVVLKVSGLLDAGEGKKPTVTVAPESESTDPQNEDPDHDVFILRIGKKGLVGMDEKSDIQLEMRTPKGPERRPPLRYETREMQTEEDKAKKEKKGKKKKK